MKNSVRVLVYDFDEVVVKGSDGVKQRAWPVVFAAFADAYREPLQEAQIRFGHGRGGDRFTIMDAVFRAVGVADRDVPSHIAAGAEVYDAFVQKGIVEIGVEDDAREALALLARTYPQYINTATPEAPFGQTFEALGLSAYFEGFYGRPNDKITNLARIAEREGVEPTQILFVGDAEKDREAAERFGCQFVGFATAENDWREATQAFPVIGDIAEIPELLGLCVDPC